MSYQDLLSIENKIPAIEEEVKKTACKKHNDAYLACCARIAGSDDPDKNCTGWYWELYTCVGQKSAAKIFATLR